LKLHKLYQPLVEHTGRYTIVTGGRGSGKSYALVHFLLKLSFTAGHKIMIMRLTMNSSDDSTIAEVNKQIEELDLSEYFTINKTVVTNKLSKSTIIFKGLKGNSGESTGRMKSLSGVTTIVFEEAEELRDESLFNKIDEGIRDKNKHLRVMIVLNPATKVHWIYKRFFLENNVNEGYNGIKGDTCYIHTTYLNNLKNLEASTIKLYERHKKHNPAYYNHAILGGWLEKSEGVIFTNWEFGDFPDTLIMVRDSKLTALLEDTDLNVVETFFGADWGYKNDPSTLVEVAIDKKNEIIYLKEHLYEAGKSTTQLGKIFKKVCGNKLIIADSSEGRLIDEIKQNHGVNIRQCKKGAGSVNQGIKLMQGYKLIVDRTSTNLAIELNNYSWKDKGENPCDEYNHLIDAARYIITDRIKPTNKNGIYHFY